MFEPFQFVWMAVTGSSVTNLHKSGQVLKTRNFLCPWKCFSYLDFSNSENSDTPSLCLFKNLISTKVKILHSQNWIEKTWPASKKNWPCKSFTTIHAQCLTGISGNLQNKRKGNNNAAKNFLGSVLSLFLGTIHILQKRNIIYISSFLILVAQNAQHQFFMSASFCITTEQANICKHFTHSLCIPCSPCYTM